MNPIIQGIERFSTASTKLLDTINLKINFTFSLDIELTAAHDHDQREPLKQLLAKFHVTFFADDDDKRYDVESGLVGKHTHIIMSYCKLSGAR